MKFFVVQHQNKSLRIKCQSILHKNSNYEIYFRAVFYISFPLKFISRFAKILTNLFHFCKKIYCNYGVECLLAHFFDIPAFAVFLSCTSSCFKLLFLHKSHILLSIALNFYAKFNKNIVIHFVILNFITKHCII